MGFYPPQTFKGSAAALGASTLPWNFFLQTQLHETSLEVFCDQYLTEGMLWIKLTSVHWLEPQGTTSNPASMGTEFRTDDLQTAIWKTVHS